MEPTLVKADKYESFEKELALLNGKTEQLNINLVDKFGGLNIMSVPIGAMVYLNDAQVGKTKYKSEKLVSGKYRLKLIMSKHYDEILDNIEIVKDKSTQKSYTFKYSQAYYDSVKAVRNNNIDGVCT